MRHCINGLRHRSWEQTSIDVRPSSTVRVNQDAHQGWSERRIIPDDDATAREATGIQVNESRLLGGGCWSERVSSTSVVHATAWQCSRLFGDGEASVIKNSNAQSDEHKAQRQARDAPGQLNLEWCSCRPIGPGAERSLHQLGNVAQGSAGWRDIQGAENQTPRASRPFTANDPKGASEQAAPPCVTSRRHSRTTCGAREGNDVRASRDSRPPAHPPAGAQPCCWPATAPSSPSTSGQLRGVERRGVEQESRRDSTLDSASCRVSFRRLVTSAVRGLVEHAFPWLREKAAVRARGLGHAG
ncbi:hypothetical protein SNOG_07212 [Parastagonospora nodorum SN15]|uniref:Uncharacterized protein n=1 Tax=Phaeosphaeria nodorum (strain SN15 / ATCC MYA-4574 / FGSC 10173) TaxID=321614 RepID=Q0UM02_PHANO|nr:hypothetical protein SNOG_07212 [Parastagonospora nodorum SN15]EAT85863.1 hypothetical protein SNOG_07212 [Parastagonospora nodorum SN15]